MKKMRCAAVLILSFVAGAAAPAPGANGDDGAPGDEAPAPPAASAQRPEPSLPDVSGEGVAVRQILNPYYTRPVWRLWQEDESPLRITLNRREEGKAEPQKEDLTFAPPAAKDRKYPVLPEGGRVAGAPPLQAAPGAAPAVAGFWDDAYMSLDNGHSNLRAPAGQFIVGPRVITSDGEDIVRLRLALGVNFTSQSYARRGRHIVDDMWNSLNTERFFYFANAIRATPAHASYNDNDPERVHDDYDGLYSHSYQSVGQSGSEVRALEKMLMAGACLPRPTKELLKEHGAYAAALLAIFKAALPYADADGRDLPFEHELRHRPAYSSSGDVGHPHFCAANAVYHGYDETRHLGNMVELARRLDAAPPVAILRYVSLTVTKDGATLVENATQDERAKSATLTQARFWGGEGETLALTIDLSSSYDLQGRELTFACQPLHPNQKNVSVRDLGGGRFEIVARHDPALPKGRLPVIAVARNGGPLPSSPVFVNFYWPQPDERVDFFHFDPARLPDEEKKKFQEQFGKLNWKDYPVTVNRRPVPDFGFEGDALRCRPGETVTFPVKATDPDGYPVSVYRYADEPGELRGGVFSYPVPRDATNGVREMHFIFSDGTGGYAGRRVKLLVSDGADDLAPGWHVTALGRPPEAAAVKMDRGGAFAFGAVNRSVRKGAADGTFLYRELEGDADWLIEWPPDAGAGADAEPDLALMLRGGLDGHWRFVSVARPKGLAEAVVRSGESGWGSSSAKPAIVDASPARRLRLVRRGGRVAVYVSAGGDTWELLVDRRMEFREALAGVYYGGGGGAAGRIVTDSPPLPGIRQDGDARGRLIAPFKVAMDAPAPDAVLRYTLDGSDPGASSPACGEPFAIDQPGRHELRVRAFGRDGRAAGPVVGAVLNIEEPEKKKGDAKRGDELPGE